MKGHAEHYDKRFRNLQNSSTTHLQRVTTPCMYDHAHGKDDFETDEELDDICAQITFKNIFLEKEDPIYFDPLTYWQEL